MVARIATGEVEDSTVEKNPHAAALGAKGGKATAAKLDATQRSEAAKIKRHRLDGSARALAARV
jgi:hypothetical protein